MMFTDEAYFTYQDYSLECYENGVDPITFGEWLDILQRELAEW